MFKVNQKVVALRTEAKNDVGIIKDEIYTCLGADPFYKDEMRIKELPHPTKGFWCAHFEWFRPLDYSFGEKLASEIEQEINQEQLVIK